MSADRIQDKIPGSTASLFLAAGFDAVNSLLKSGRGSERTGAVNAALLTPRSLCFVLESMSFYYFSKVGL